MAESLVLFLQVRLTLLKTCDKVLKFSLFVTQVIFLQDPIGSLFLDREE